MIDYHTHTWRCGHAEGNVAEYVQAALDAGISEIGISDHFPMDVLDVPYDDISSMLYTDLGEYISEVNQVRSEFASDIKVKLGTEIDFFKGYEGKISGYIEKYQWDYVIGSIHFLESLDISHPDNIDFYEQNPLPDIYERYLREIKVMAASGLFDILGHIDVVKKHGYVLGEEDLSDHLSQLYVELAKLFADNKQVVEINTGGLRAPVEELYPAPDFIEQLVHFNVPLTIGSDAHSPEEVAYYNREVVEFLRNLGVKSIIGFDQRAPYEIKI